MDVNMQELKAGDRVGVSSLGWNRFCEIRTVSRRTATQVVLDDGTRWNKYGKKIGETSSYHRAYLISEAEAIECNREEQKRTARLALLREVRDLNFKDVSDEGLKLILAVAKDHPL